MKLVSYFKPNLRFIDLLRALFISDHRAKEQIKKYFNELTGKKFILLTNSCRTALYLSYKALDVRGEVITSPLTCKVAIDPINETGNIPIFADINQGDLNISPGDIGHRITDNTIAIQVIHLGGVSCNMGQILSIADKKKIFVIEDCAQSLGAKYEGVYTGSFGDVACFSLIKNAYGIGGGILATNDEKLYFRAKALNDKFPKPPFPLIMFRIIRTLIATKRGIEPFTSLYDLIVFIKGKRQSYISVFRQLRKISLSEKKIAAVQIRRFEKLHRERKIIGKRYREILMQNKLMMNHKFDQNASSYTKFYIFHPSIRAEKHMVLLAEKGVEAMHLEEKSYRPYQEPIVPFDRAVEIGLINYIKVHDSILSIPLNDNFTNSKIEKIVVPTVDI